LNDKHQKNGKLICHSAAGEESPTFIEFLTRRIIKIYVIIFKDLKNEAKKNATRTT
jgi:hypothetical protein